MFIMHANVYRRLPLYTRKEYNFNRILLNSYLSLFSNFATANSNIKNVYINRLVLEKKKCIDFYYRHFPFYKLSKNYTWITISLFLFSNFATASTKNKCNNININRYKEENVVFYYRQFQHHLFAKFITQLIL